MDSRQSEELIFDHLNNNDDADSIESSENSKKRKWTEQDAARKGRRRTTPIDGDQPLKSREEIIAFFEKSKESTHTDFLEKSYSLFGLEPIIFKNDPYLEICVNAGEVGRSRPQRSKYSLGVELYFSLMAKQDSDCYLGFRYDGNTITLRVKFNQFTDDVLENFFHRVLFIYFLKVHLGKKLPYSKILDLIKEQLARDQQIDVVLALKEKIIEMYPNDDELRTKIDNFFNNPIMVKNAPSGLGNDQESFSFSIESKKEIKKRKSTSTSRQHRDQNKKVKRSKDDKFVDAVLEQDISQIQTDVTLQNEEAVEPSSPDISHVESKNKAKYTPRPNARPKVLKTRGEALNYIVNSKPESISDILTRYLSIFKPKNHKIFIGKRCVEIHSNKIISFDQVTGKAWPGLSTFIPLLEPNKQFDCRGLYYNGRMVIRVDFKHDVTSQDIINFILRLKFLNFIKSGLKLATIEKILEWMKLGCDVDALIGKIVEQAEDKDLIRAKIYDYFLQTIKYENIFSDLLEDNSTDIQQHNDILSGESNPTAEENHETKSFKPHTRKDSVKYLKSRISTETEMQKKYDNNTLNKFLWLFQQDKHELTIVQQYAEIRANIPSFSKRKMDRFLIALRAFSVFFVPEDENLDFTCSCDGQILAMRFEFKNGVSPQEINHIIRMINFVHFAKDNLKYNFNRIHELFSLMIERTDIFDALREEVVREHPNDQEILDRIHYYFPESVDNENSLSEVNDTTNQVNLDAVGRSSSETTLESLGNVQPYTNEELDDLLRQFPECASTADSEAADGREQRGQQESDFFSLSEAALKGFQINSQFSNRRNTVSGQNENQIDQLLFDITNTK